MGIGTGLEAALYGDAQQGTVAAAMALKCVVLAKFAFHRTDADIQLVQLKKDRPA